MKSDGVKRMKDSDCNIHASFSFNVHNFAA